MNVIKFAITYLDGTKEVIYGSGISEQRQFFRITIALDDDVRYVTIPWAAVKKLEEE